MTGKAQSLGGADSYNVTEGDGAFNLGVTAEDNAKLTYSSDNEGVVRVDEKGNVTIAGVGTAKSLSSLRLLQAIRPAARRLQSL